MFKQILIVLAVLALLPLLLKLAVKTRLIIPLLYVAVVAVFFSAWATEHEIVSFGILGLLVLLVVISWLWPVIARIRDERLMKKALLLQIVAAREKSAEPLTVTIEDGIPIVRTNE